MQRISAVVFTIICVMASLRADAASKAHVISFGKWTAVKWVDADGRQMLDMKVRSISIDARVKEFTTGAPHDVTERLFVVRRAIRVNDALPGEAGVRWQWQRGGWLMIDRVTG